ncbi:MAG TPA: RHS repeat-associated core domain-containing protein, partial [Bacillota bacterium]|nr:RHS repeat-associated core domain-containing protein [Bacillota bacterium]
NYSYDSVGNITQIGNDYYNYDGLNRLTWAGNNPTPATGNGIVWTYDGAGNITGKENYLDGVSQGNISFTYDLANRLGSMGSKTYINDNAGNRIGKTDTNAWGYIYDGENRLKQVTRNGVDVLDNAYDGAGMRIKEVKGGQTTYFVYQGNNPLLEYTPSDGTYKYFIYAGNKLVAEETNGVVKYYHSDHLGSTRMVTDSAGNRVAEYKFSPYGEKEAYSGSFSTEYQFTGKPGIDEVGLSYFGARWYDPETGRFITQDPAKDGLNWYEYCYDNPLKLVDPTGKKPTKSTGPQPSWGQKLLYSIENTISNAIPPIALIEANNGRAFISGRYLTYKEQQARIKNAKSGVIAAIFPTGTPSLGDKAYRYVSGGEAKFIMDNGYIPNTDAKGNLKNIFVSPEYYGTASEAEQGLRIGSQNPYGATESPQYRVEFNMNAIRYNYAGNVEGGTGIEMTTSQNIPIDGIYLLGE